LPLSHSLSKLNAVSRASACTALLLCSATAIQAQTAAVLAAAGYAAPAPVEVAPGQVVTLFFRGVRPGADGKPRIARSVSDPAPARLAGLAVRIAQPGRTTPLEAPVLAVHQENECDAAQPAQPVCLLTAVQVQIPHELDFLSPAGIDIRPAADLILDDEGQPSRRYPARVVSDNAHVLTSCDVNGEIAPEGDCARSAYHSDGRPVSAAAPARYGDTIVVYAYGLGQTSPAAATGRAASGPAPLVERIPGSPFGRGVWVSFRKDLVNASPSIPRRIDDQLAAHPGVPMAYAGLAPGQLGVYQINVPIPPLSSFTVPCGPEVRANAILTVTTAMGTENVPICLE
jgi:uncharacterized protein (TIGR03437 family)